MGNLIGISRSCEESQLAAMGAALAHRGGAGNVVELAGGGAMAGVSAGGGTQPWRRDELVMCGEIDLFNAGELREFLHSGGVSFGEGSAGDLVLALWQAGGADHLQRVNGDFALAIADGNTGAVHLLRDRSGARPLYYCRAGDRWLFASEYKAFLADPSFDRSINRAALQMVHVRKVVPADQTLFAAVKQVPAQSVVSLGADGSVSVRRYWNVSVGIDQVPLAEHVERLADRFCTAIARRLPDTGAIGLSLSGGVDSVAMAFALRRADADRPIHTYSIGDSAEDPELSVAAQVADRIGATHREFVFSTDDLASRMQRLAWSLEDPIARTESLMTQDICEAASADVHVMLRGDGADGLFGGMDRHKILALAERLPPASPILKDVYTYSQTGAMPRNPLSWLLIRGYFRSSIPAPPSVLGYEAPAPALVAFKGHRELLNRVLHKGAEHALPMLLQKIERPHAAAGMRTFSPFIDNDLVAAAHAVPSLMKNNGQRNKIVFREAVRNFVPEDFVRLPKYAQRVRETVEFCDALESVVTEQGIVDSLLGRDVFERGSVERLLKREPGKAWAPEHAMRVWTLVLTEFWFRQFAGQS